MSDSLETIKESVSRVKALDTEMSDDMENNLRLLDELIEAGEQVIEAVSADETLSADPLIQAHLETVKAQVARAEEMKARFTR